MKNWKLNKYIKKVRQPLESEEFLMLFSKCSVLGYSNTTLGYEDYTVLKEVLNQIVEKIENNLDFKELFLSDDGFLFPYEDESWFRVSMMNKEPIGLTFYLDNSYKLFLFENEKLVTLNKISTTTVRDAQFIEENMLLA